MVTKLRYLPLSLLPHPSAWGQNLACWHLSALSLPQPLGKLRIANQFTFSPPYTHQQKTLCCMALLQTLYGCVICYVNILLNWTLWCALIHPECTYNVCSKDLFFCLYSLISFHLFSLMCIRGFEGWMLYLQIIQAQHEINTNILSLQAYSTSTVTSYSIIPTNPND